MRRKYHLNSPLWPKFAINGDTVDGNIPSTMVKSWSHLVEVINKDPLFNQAGQMLYRGQRCAHWGLTPSIARLSGTGIYEDEWAQQHCVNALKRMNIHYANLYPDVTGPSLHCNGSLTEHVRTAKQEDNNL